uniref:Uncharacterized protein n=1 Tax=Trichuris muris TaxID=70415 RepID=A0A5S6R553_TRIMR
MPTRSTSRRESRPMTRWPTGEISLTKINGARRARKRGLNPKDERPLGAPQPTDGDATLGKQKRKGRCANEGGQLNMSANLRIKTVNRIRRNDQEAGVSGGGGAFVLAEVDVDSSMVQVGQTRLLVLRDGAVEWDLNHEAPAATAAGQLITCRCLLRIICLRHHVLRPDTSGSID